MIIQGGEDMAENRADIRSTSPENFEKLYASLSESDKALISAYMNMTFALLRSMQAMAEGKKGA